MTPEAELLDVIVRFRQQVDRLSVWKAGHDRLHALLRMALLPRAESARRGLEVMDFPWESLVELMVRWHFDHPLGDEICHEADVYKALELATQFMRLDPLETAIRAGTYRIRKNSGAFKLSYQWDMAPEVADMYLERKLRPFEMQRPSSAEVDWASSQSREHLNRFVPPVELLSAASSRALSAMTNFRAYRPEGTLPNDFDLGEGLTVEAMTAVIATLMGMAELGELAHRRVAYPGTMMFHALRTVIVDLVSQINPSLSERIIEVALDRLMVGPRRSLRTSLLIPNGDFISILPLLMFPRVLDASMLRTAASDTSLFGPIGKRQGERATALAGWLRLIPGVKVLEGLKIKDENRKLLGDLDVVAVDPLLGKGVILEVKWPIEAVTISDVRSTDNWIVKGAEQLDGLRERVRARGELVKFPPGWPSFDSVEWEWCVCTSDQLSPRPLSHSDMMATSFRYLASLGAASDLNEVIGILHSPDYPKRGLHFEIRPTNFRFGRHIFNVDSIILLDVEWSPAFRSVE
ncbi:hypothetical protein [Nocardia vulneris]|uniref:hypothetical protein n=1 Tax=Nocardia vulneris TaxID=1141657 RepID=UPI000B19C675|nr:hypothetical protein [Nocardia vulneris]